jgi:hypothetical protein
MARVLFSISYAIKPELRNEYLALIQAMKSHYTAGAGKDYTVYEVKGKPNHFTEIFVSQSLEEYEALEDAGDEIADELVGKLERFLAGGKTNFTTLVELG